MPGTQGVPPEADQEQAQASANPPAGLPAGGCPGWLLGYSCALSLGAHGNAGTWVIFSSIATPSLMIPALTAVVHPEEPDEGADLEGCPLPEVLPSPAASPLSSELGPPVQHLKL